MENLDLDITNYSIKDITKFFKLKEKSTYKVEEIELRENEIRQQLLNSGHINKRFKKDLIDFLDKAKNWLIQVKCEKKAPPTSIPTNYKLDTINNPVYLAPHPKQENIIERPKTQFMYTQESEFLPGNLNLFFEKLTIFFQSALVRNVDLNLSICLSSLSIKLS